mmetsp:Transcript_57692/g.133205  ORF Transcript_57692/g.133205 Transcript_57692/m.133205 type:complete len:93 (-) Transcript_57692:1012-1290(-)
MLNTKMPFQASRTFIHLRNAQLPNVLRRPTEDQERSIGRCTSWLPPRVTGSNDNTLLDWEASLLALKTNILSSPSHCLTGHARKSSPTQRIH